MENVSESLRGECTRYMLEVKAGVFVGNITQPVREFLWQKILKAQTGGAILIYSYPNEQGFTMLMTGDPYRKLIDLDGIQLIRRITKSPAN